MSEQLGSYVAQHTLYAYYRPFGATSIVGGVDEDGPQLYMIEPSGLYWGYFGAAAGKGKQVAKNELEKLDLKNMTCREAVYKAAKMYLFLLCLKLTLASISRMESQRKIRNSNWRLAGSVLPKQITSINPFQRIC